MSINPEEIRLTPEQQEQLAQVAEQSGQAWQELLARVIGALPAEPSNGSGDQGKSAYDLLSEAGLIGCIEGGPADVSSNPKYMEGFGQRADTEDTG
jgi:hypothetical protein